MKKVKLGLYMALLVSSSMMAQQSISTDDTKFELASNTSDKTLTPSVKSENSTKKDSNKVASINDIKMYPNPASDIVTLQGVSVDDEIIILDNNGKKWIKIKAKAEVEIIPIDHLKSGIYTISINGTNKKLVKE